MFKWKAAKVIVRQGRFLKYGFVITEHQYMDCPRCRSVLNAGPNYQPAYCDRCGQKLNFEGVNYEPDREVGYARDDEKKGEAG